MRHGLKKWRDIPPSAQARTADTSLSFRGHQNNMPLQVKTSAKAILVNLGVGMNLARGERFEVVRKEGFIKKQNIRLMFSATNIIIGIDLKFKANKENM